MSQFTFTGYYADPNPIECAASGTLTAASALEIRIAVPRGGATSSRSRPAPPAAKPISRRMCGPTMRGTATTQSVNIVFHRVAGDELRDRQ